MKKERTWSSMNLRQNGMIIALIVIILGFGIATGGTLFRPMNISNIFTKLLLNHFCNIFGVAGVAAKKDADDCHE